MRLLDLRYGKSQVQGSISMNRTEQKALALLLIFVMSIVTSLETLMSTQTHNFTVSFHIVKFTHTKLVEQKIGHAQDYMA
ncbi:hypothetical protein YC2023_014881 [Brassica napus]